MRMLPWILVGLALVTPTLVDAKKRTHVVVQKPYPGRPAQLPANPLAVALLAPPVLVFYDLQRRTSCEGDVLGLGGPGFDSPITPASGNVMIPAQQRRICQAPAPTR